MCGIIGVFPGTEEEIAEGLATIAHRGRDARGILSIQGGAVGHVLHALVDHVEQPLIGEGVLLFNGEIWNWRSLAEEHGIAARNDAQLVLGLLDAHPLAAVRGWLDGDYALAYVRDGTVTLMRDQLGIKPLWYVHDEERFAFASERKALVALGHEARELHPRSVLTYILAERRFRVETEDLSIDDPTLALPESLTEAVRKRLPRDGRIGVLFSGGIDSALLAHLAKRLGADVTCYVAALDDPEKKEPHDLLAAREAARLLDLPLVEVRATLAEVESLLEEIPRRIEDSSPVKVGVALPLWLCAERAREDGQRALFSGLGAEEVFAGYQRHTRALDINEECLRGLRHLHERDLYRDDVVGMSHTLEIRLPFLDRAVIAAGMAIPGDDKIVDGRSKVPLRVAAKHLGLPARIADRPKKAAQYGSQFDAALDKLARRQGTTKSGLLQQYYPRNRRLCALLSSGKDSVYALHVMRGMNHAVACCATIRSENPDSYMFHTPLIGFARLQAESMGLPLLEETTPGEKEVELDALRAVLARAQREHGVDGVVSGALFSRYQRSRIERVCEELGLQVFAPLWHLDQEQEVREILDAGFTFVLSKVAADGLDRSWVGRPITHADVDTLSGRLGLNVAGEGGEYESLVLDGPGFARPIVLEDVSVACERDGSSGDVCVLRASGRLA